MNGTNLAENFIHLGQSGTAVVQPRFTGDMSWYQGYLERHGDDGLEGRLVSLHRFSQSWDAWEVHPNGCEVVICLSGQLQVIQEHPDGSRQSIPLSPGEYAVNPPGVWHTADVEEDTTAVFITAGLGTQHRPR